VRFKVDSAIGSSHEVDMTLYVEDPVRKDTVLVKEPRAIRPTPSETSTSLTDYDPKRPYAAARDTLYYNGVHFRGQWTSFKHRPDMLYDKLFFTEWRPLSCPQV
jgi:hypothetical protein